MDGFCKSGKDYLVFTDRFYMDGYYLSPVVAYCKKDINSYKTDLSMTNFKKMFKFYSSSNDIIYEEKSREYPLVKCLYNLSLENASKGVLPFDLPCQFNAQDSKNRTGYGNEYWGDELIYEGPKYGETTTYYFIGVLIKPIN